jgi:hypothetical protein
MQTKKMRFAPVRVAINTKARGAGLLKKKAGLHQDALAAGLRPSPKQDLIFRGGKTIPNLTFVNFYVAGQTAWNAADIQNIDSALAAAMSDRNLNNVMMQYFDGKPISTKASNSVKLPGPAPAVFSQGDAEGLVLALNSQQALATFDLTSTVVNLMLPPGTVLTTDEAPTSAVRSLAAAPKNDRAIPHEDEASSQNGLGGFHGSVHLTMSGVAQTIYYAVGVFSETAAGGQANGIPAFNEPWKNVVATFYHELNEARTDPDVEDAVRTGDDSVLGWTSAQGEEVGDFPVDETNGDLSLVFQEVSLTDGSRTVPIQFMYSNAVHGPEGPIKSPHVLV